jgi:hypothetical protein
MRQVTVTREQARTLEAIASDEGQVEINQGHHGNLMVASDARLYVVFRTGAVDVRDRADREVARDAA